MKRLLFFLQSLGIFTAAAFAGEAVFYVGTSTAKESESQGIYKGGIDSETGALAPLVLAAKAESPAFLALAPDGKSLYAAAVAPGTAPTAGVISAFKVEADGKLSPVNEQPSGGVACHVSVDAAGRHLLAAHYSASSAALLPIRDDGSLGEPTALLELAGSGPHPKRQAKPHPHGFYTDPEGRFAYLCDLGTDEIRVFRLDPARGTPVPADPPSAKTPPGSGPRHLAFHPDGRFAYVCNEMGISVTAFARNAETGALTSLETLPTVPAGTPEKGVTTAEIVCHPSGKWLYVSNRGHNSVAVFAIGGDGRLTPLEVVPAQVETPWSIAIDPTGRWMIAAGRQDNRIAVLKIDQATGKLTPTGQHAAVGRPMCVLFGSNPKSKSN